nr:hypothetical protein [Dendronalium sp. ChiSLP03b]MDZ8209035.1 hypothetical protein [Dendronalium sp. ChiSLP03b]
MIKYTTKVSRFFDEVARSCGNRKGISVAFAVVPVSQQRAINCSHIFWLQSCDRMTVRQFTIIHSVQKVTHFKIVRMTITTDTQHVLSNNQQIRPTEPLEYRAIGRLWGKYVPSDELIYQGQLITADGVMLETNLAMLYLKQ